jgi:hypothetical protein
MSPELQALRQALEDVGCGAPEPLAIGALRQLLDLGLLRDGAAAPSAKLELTPDGSDVLDALRSPQRWVQVERAAAQQRIALDVDTVKAAVAAAISGGFNA